MTKASRRCAIYTRVSSDQRLEQDFNSLDAQREACAAYIKSQASEGWKAVSRSYDDGGFSGGSLERPGVQQLLEDIKNRKVDIIVVYKVDRLTRSLADFAKLVELFDKHGVSFVSVTQSFNTTTSMGRLTLNVLLSFAQFEREVTGERIRDKIAASKIKGMWVGGVVPLGYRVESKRLVVDEEEAKTVRLIFERYLELGSLPAVQRELLERGIRSRRRVLSSERVVGDIPLTNGPIDTILRNRVYLGEINHHGKSYPGEHAAILEEGLFDAVQARLTENLQGRRRERCASEALLTGKIYDDKGNRMSPTYALKKGVRYRYYVSTACVQGQQDKAGTVKRVPTAEIEEAVADALVKCLGNTEYRDEPAGKRALIEKALERVVVRPGRLDVVVTEESSRESEREATDMDTELPSHRTLSVLYVRPPTSRKRDLLLPADSQGGLAKPMKVENTARLLRAIDKSFSWLDDLLDQKVPDMLAIARREGCSERSVRHTLSLAFLAPEIITATIEARLPRGFGTTRLTELPTDWSEQSGVLGMT